MKIVIDAFGGDNAPYEIIKGGLMSLDIVDDLKIIFSGYEDKIKECLNKFSYDKSRIEILPAGSVIDNNDSPTQAFKEKKDSSLVVAFEELKKDPQCIALISAGSTGAILTGGFLKIGRIKGVSRPALCPFLPTLSGGQVLLLDAGANVDCKPINLCHFAAMGSAYFTAVTGKQNPKVALLNLGTEEHKGNELCKQAFLTLSQMDINFVGNMEARDLMSGNYDVVVADGFSGNIALKATEGALKTLLSQVKKTFKKNIFTKIGAIFMTSGIKDLKQKFDFDVYGGSPFLGCKKTVIKSHGSSKAMAIVQSVKTAINLENIHFNEKIENSVSEVKMRDEITNS